MQKPPRKITSYNALEKLGRVRLSENFFMREMLYSSIGDYYGLSNWNLSTLDLAASQYALLIVVLQ